MVTVALPGAVAVAVVPGRTAGAIGLARADVVTALGDTPVEDPRNRRNRIGALPPGAEGARTGQRGSRRIALAV